MVSEHNDSCNRREERMTKCRVRDCPYYRIWSAWSECAVSCGTGLIPRSRTCYNGVDGIDCIGDGYQQSECYATEKGFTMWSDWTECTVTCGGGMKSRKAHICTNEIDEQTVTCKAHTGSWSI